jgi:transposase-like protein
MPGQHPPGLKSKLALAVAAGQSITQWARDHGIGVRTAYTWSRAPEFRSQVAELRDRLLDRAIGVLARRVAANAAEINRLASKAESEAVRLAAARAGIADLLGASRFVELRAEVEELKRELAAEKARRAGSPGQDPS